MVISKIVTDQPFLGAIRKPAPCIGAGSLSHMARLFGKVEFLVLDHQDHEIGAGQEVFVGETDRA
jgi:hypothetical protein